MIAYGIIQSPRRNNNFLLVASQAGTISQPDEIDRIINKKDVVVSSGKILANPPVRLWVARECGRVDCFIELPCIDMDDLGRNIKIGLLLIDVAELDTGNINNIAGWFDPPLHISEENVKTALKLYNKAVSCKYKLFYYLFIFILLIIIYKNIK